MYPIVFVMAKLLKPFIPQIVPEKWVLKVGRQTDAAYLEVFTKLYLTGIFLLNHLYNRFAYFMIIIFR